MPIVRGCKRRWNAHNVRMIIILSILVAISMAATLGVLFAGMLGVVRGSPDAARSNRLMRWRVIMQGITIVLFVLLLSLVKH
jgi:hypothetical protein